MAGLDTHVCQKHEKTTAATAITFWESPAVAMSERDNCAARRRCERRLRAWVKHDKFTVAMVAWLLAQSLLERQKEEEEKRKKEEGQVRLSDEALRAVGALSVHTRQWSQPR